MDEVSASGAGDSRLESWLGHLCRPPSTKEGLCDIRSRRTALADEKIKVETRDRTGDLQICSLMLSQLSYRGFEITESDVCAVGGVLWGGIEKQDATHHGQRR